MRERLKAGAGQIAPAMLDTGGTIAKIAGTLAEARRHGLDLLVFPDRWDVRLGRLEAMVEAVGRKLRP
jgi:predicted amidohydrolase